MPDKPDAAPGSFASKVSATPLASDAERIASAKDQATQGRVERGLPPVDDGPFSEAAMAARRKRRKR